VKYKFSYGTIFVGAHLMQYLSNFKQIIKRTFLLSAGVFLLLLILNNVASAKSLNTSVKSNTKTNAFYNTSNESVNNTTDWLFESNDDFEEQTERAPLVLFIVNRYQLFLSYFTPFYSYKERLSLRILPSCRYSYMPLRI
jgi:ABC-type transport system involved in cytochrome bd biosynthesis fused ATPase/permease subunit